MHLSIDKLPSTQLHLTEQSGQRLREADNKSTEYYELALSAEVDSWLRALGDAESPATPPEKIGPYLTDHFADLRELTAQFGRELLTVIGVDNTTGSLSVHGLVPAYDALIAHKPSRIQAPENGEIVMITHTHPVLADDGTSQLSEVVSEGDFRAIQSDLRIWNCMVSPKGAYLISARYAADLPRDREHALTRFSFSDLYGIKSTPQTSEEIAETDGVAVPDIPAFSDLPPKTLRKIKAGILVCRRYGLEYYFCDPEGTVTVLSTGLNKKTKTVSG